MTPMIPVELQQILSGTPELERANLVGGCVRDWLLGLQPKDLDVEVFGVSYDRLVKALSRWGGTDVVGRSFGVVKLNLPGGGSYDFSIPRRDSKVGPGHTGFRMTFDSAITPRDAAARRDYTINAIAYDPRSGEWLDFFEGRRDLQRRILRHTSEAYTEDPLRVLRGMQLAGRFNLEPAPETVQLCREIAGTYSELAVERVGQEWFKWAARSTVPSAGLRFLQATGWIRHFPELAALQGLPQDPGWHPEGDVFAHTCHCCDALASLPAWQAADEESRVVYMLAVLAHDFGKAETTQEAVIEGRTRIVSPGHDRAGVPRAERFLERIDSPTAIACRVVPLVANHMAHLQVVSDRVVRRLARRLAPETLDGLCLVMTADSFGRPPSPRRLPEAVVALQDKAAELNLRDRAPKPILLGRHLIEAGRKPGPEFARILEAAFEAQLEGQFADLAGARRWLNDWLERSDPGC